MLPPVCGCLPAVVATVVLEPAAAVVELDEVVLLDPLSPQPATTTAVATNVNSHTRRFDLIALPLLERLPRHYPFGDVAAATPQSFALSYHTRRGDAAGRV
jgi:hypothetical protein